MITNKTKIVGLIAFFLFILCFFLDFVAVLISFGSIESAGSLKGTMVMLYIFEILFEFLIIGCAVFGVYKLAIKADRDSAFRRGIDCVGSFAVFIAFAEFYAIHIVNEIARHNNTTYPISGTVVAIIVFTVIAAVLALVASLKKVKMPMAARTFLTIGSALLMIVVLIILLAQGSLMTLTVVEYIILIIGLVTFMAFIYFCMEDQRAEELAATNKPEEPAFEENKSLEE